jgi:hypothetical protein
MNSVPLMYALMSFGTAVRRISLLRLTLPVSAKEGNARVIGNSTAERIIPTLLESGARD